MRVNPFLFAFIMMGAARAIWAGILTVLVANSVALQHVILPLLGLDERERIAFMVASWMFPPFLPLESLIGLFLTLAGFAWRAMAVQPFDQVGLGMAMGYVMGGIHAGLYLTVLSRWSPMMLRKALSLHMHITPPSRIAAKVVPTTFSQLFGVPFTLLSELLIIPCAVTLLYIFGQLKSHGDDFDKWKKTPKKDTVVVLVHGNRFNECQWVWGRILMHSFFPNVEFMTVNYFQGPLKREHTAETMTIEGCSKIVIEQVSRQLKDRGIEPKSMVWQGHSLGGVVCCNIAANSADDKSHDFPITDVISWSAPLAGSDLLKFGERNGITKPHGIELDFHPDSPKLLDLRRKIKASSKSIRYFGISGGCDPLVLGKSALPECFEPDRRAYIPYLGHYNIKISWQAWSIVLNHLASVLEQ